MIKKILKIKNFGKFKKPVFGQDTWNGLFDQTNVIYERMQIFRVSDGYCQAH
jgi:hypothetical protein